MAEYHLHAKTHSRGIGKGAGGHARYILRQGPYAEKKVEQTDGSAIAKTRVSRAAEVLHSESGNLPVWATDEKGYWDAADQYERANGTVYREIEFALPKELSDSKNIRLARSFAEALAAVPGGKTPYTFAIHKGERDPSLLHCHLMLSDKINDGIDRDATLWFKRAAVSPKNKNPVDPARGGAPKTQARIGAEWLGEVVRPLWAEMANAALAHVKVDARIDHRSLEVRRLEQEQLAARARHEHHEMLALQHTRSAEALDRPPEPKKGRVLTHAGAEKAPGRAAMVVDFEVAKAARAQAVEARRLAEAEMERDRQAVERAQAVLSGARVRQSLRDSFEKMRIRERWRARQAERAKRRKRAQVLERARVRHGYRRDSWEIRERWAFRQQERARRREEERLLEAQEQREREEQALDDQVAAATAPGVRYPQRSRWREWRAQTLSRKYDPAYSAEMAERDIYCRWMPDHGGLYLKLGKAEVIDQGPLLLAKNGTLDIPLLIATAQGKGWETLTFTGPAEFQEKAAIAALQAGLAVADADLSQRAQAVIEAQREQERIDAANRAGIADAVGQAKKVPSELGRDLCELIEKHGTLEATADELAGQGLSHKDIAVRVSYLVNERLRGQTKDRRVLTNEEADQIGREAVLRHQQEQEKAQQPLIMPNEAAEAASRRPIQRKKRGLEL
ncbi:MobA/MobL family protein [Acidithiobacillus thiooxidans]|uniref:MobA/MobL family protein n=1 Tax=Acidithiobacillus thiooxidans TaxID=930 RepID=UPI0009DB337F|nr:MobA/MobL family protein [Acidithiobacillus thiooxidans]